MVLCIRDQHRCIPWEEEEDVVMVASSHGLRANISIKRKAPSHTQLPVGSAMPKDMSIMSNGVSSVRHWIVIDVDDGDGDDLTSSSPS
mmetsp:Transcript_26528/g.45273  ORF Transcript_26528/g.45273 Transcript_26528/m.45273 type:complete len:88 (+) Transcript_26528:810-1073(+)